MTRACQLLFHKLPGDEGADPGGPGRPRRLPAPAGPRLLADPRPAAALHPAARLRRRPTQPGPRLRRPDPERRGFPPVEAGLAVRRLPQSRPPPRRGLARARASHPPAGTAGNPVTADREPPLQGHCTAPARPLHGPCKHPATPLQALCTTALFPAKPFFRQNRGCGRPGFSKPSAPPSKLTSKPLFQMLPHP